jgi:hypothetical protein
LTAKHSFNLQPEIHVSGGDPFYKLHEICVPTNDELIVALKAHADHVGALTAKNGGNVNQLIRQYITMATPPDFNGAWQAITDLTTPMEKANKASEIIKAQNAAGLEPSKDEFYATATTKAEQDRVIAAVAALTPQSEPPDPLIVSLTEAGAVGVGQEPTSFLPGNGLQDNAVTENSVEQSVLDDWFPSNQPGFITLYASHSGKTKHLANQGGYHTLCGELFTHLLKEPKEGKEYRLCPKCEHASDPTKSQDKFHETTDPDKMCFAIPAHIKRELGLTGNEVDKHLTALFHGAIDAATIRENGTAATWRQVDQYVDRFKTKEQANVTDQPAEKTKAEIITKEQWAEWLKPWKGKGYNTNDCLSALHEDSTKLGQGPVTKFSEWDDTLVQAELAMQRYHANLTANLPPPENAQKSAENGATTNEAPAQPAKDDKPQAQDIPAVETTKQEAPAETKALALVTAENSLPQGLFPAPSEWQFMRDMAQAAIKSGLLPKGIKSPDAALYIIETGRELGISPALALRKIQIIQGQPTLAAELMLALVKRSGLLDYISIEGDETQCTVTMRRRGESSYVERFTMDQARKMRTSEWDENSKSSKQIPLADKFNWRTMPAVMLKWRAVSAACRTVFPDITLGIYTSEEMQDNLVLNGNTADLIIEAPAA